MLDKMTVEDTVTGEKKLFIVCDYQYSYWGSGCPDCDLGVLFFAPDPDKVAQWKRSCNHVQERFKRRKTHLKDLDYITILQKMYDNEINIQLGWFWDSGVSAIIGDVMNGITAKENFSNVIEAIDWIIVWLCHHRPEGDFVLWFLKTYLKREGDK